MRKAAVTALYLASLSRARPVEPEQRAPPAIQPTYGFDSLGSYLQAIGLGGNTSASTSNNPLSALSGLDPVANLTSATDFANISTQAVDSAAGAATGAQAGGLAGVSSVLAGFDTLSKIGTGSGAGGTGSGAGGTGSGAGGTGVQGVGAIKALAGAKPPTAGGGSLGLIIPPTTGTTNGTVPGCTTACTVCLPDGVTCGCDCNLANTLAVIAGTVVPPIESAVSNATATLEADIETGLAT
jgi:hypothetical protein